MKDSFRYKYRYSPNPFIDLAMDWLNLETTSSKKKNEEKITVLFYWVNYQLRK